MANKKNDKKRPAPAVQKNTSSKKAVETKPRLPTNSKQTVETKSGFPDFLKLALLLGLVSFAVYANTLRNGFVLDDVTVITKNKIVSKGMSAIPEILSTPYHRGYHLSPNDLYRPLTLVMFATEYEIFGKNTTPYHLINVLLYAGCIVLLFFFLDRFFNNRKPAVAFIAALLFALHPIHSEVVANIKSADELLCFFFSFLCLYLFLKYTRSGSVIQLSSGAFCFFLALLSKETVITFLAVIPLIFFFYANTSPGDKNENRARSIYITACSVAAAVIFLGIRSSVLSYYHANNLAMVDIIDNALAKQDLSISSRVATAILILGYYIKLLFIPYPLICDYSYNTIPYVNFGNFLTLLSLAFYIFLIVFGIVRLFKNKKDPYAFAVLFYLITISLFTNIFFLLGTTMGERLIFFPSLSFCLVVALLLEKWILKSENAGIAALKQPNLLAIIIPVSVIYILIIIPRNSEWKSNYTLYGADVKKAPKSAKLNYWYGLELEDYTVNDEKDPAKQKQILDEAIALLHKSLAIDPFFTDAHITLGHAFARNKQYDSAELHDNIAISQNPNNADPVNNLAGVYFNRKIYGKAIEIYKEAIKLRPDYVNPFANIGACYGSLGNFDSAISYAKAAVSIDPTFIASYRVLAATYYSIGKPDSAKKYEAMGQKNDPSFKL